MGAFLIGGFIVLAVAVVLTFTACAAIVISELEYAARDWAASPPWSTGALLALAGLGLVAIRRRRVLADQVGA